MTAPTATELVADLHAESAELDAMVSALPEDAWDTPTPSPGWTIRHQIAHLAWTDQLTLGAAAEPERFAVELAALTGTGGITDELVDRAARDAAAQPTDRLLDRWREGRTALAQALLAMPRGARIPWAVVPLSASTAATARLMETWAHGQDVADALGIVREPTERLRHVAYLGVRSRPLSFTAHNLPAPPEEVRVELTGPDGQRWEFGPPDATDRVSGPALDFCLVVTRRRHADDLALSAEGDGARQWLEVAQAYAGPPGEGRRPGQFR